MKRAQTKKCLTFGKVTFMNETWNDVGVFQMKIVMRSENIGGNGGRELASVLIMVSSN